MRSKVQPLDLENGLKAGGPRPPSHPPSNKSTPAGGSGAPPKAKEAFGSPSPSGQRPAPANASAASSSGAASSWALTSSAPGSLGQKGYAEAAGPRPPSFPPNMRAKRKQPEAKDALRKASNAMGEVAPAPFVRSLALPQVIGASDDAQAIVRATTRQEAEKVFRRIGQGAAFSKLALVGAVASDAEVAAYVVPASDAHCDENAAKLAHAGRLFQNIGCGKQRMTYNDLAAYFSADAVLYPIWDRLRQGWSRVTKVQFIEALETDGLLSSLLLPPSVMQDEVGAIFSGEKTMSSRDVFRKMSGQQEDIGFDDFARHLREGAEFRKLFACIDEEGAGSVNQIEFIGAVAARHIVTAVVLMVGSEAFQKSSSVAMAGTEAFQAAEGLFAKITGGRARASLDDFTQHFFGKLWEPKAVADASPDASVESLAQLPGTFEGEQFALLGGISDAPDGGSSGAAASSVRTLALSSSSQRHRAESPGGALVVARQPTGMDMAMSMTAQTSHWSSADTMDENISKAYEVLLTPYEWVKNRLWPSDHPLESDTIKLADSEAKTSIWGPAPTSKEIRYEDEYDHFPIFCTVISFIQFFCYIGDVGISNVTLGGPVSGPYDWRMRVYDDNCNDTRGQVWRLWTYQWLHGSISHVLGNCLLGNLLIGGLLEAVHGTKAVAWLYTVGVITGGLTMGVMEPHLPVVGSSGGTYTMLGARVVNLMINKENMPNTWYCRVACLVLFLGEDIVNYYVFYKEGTSNAAHIGGFICGVLYGGQVLENFNERPFELKLVKWFKRIFVLYIVFCILWYVTQEPGKPQGLFESAGHCRQR
mmetsp:Transcript_163970/g.521283  ORF Transcript_163970/g.521283 Transcript_163970/m.521283 type:complete len:817 (-) Transcript_163970:199-2649(-)